MYRNVVLYRKATERRRRRKLSQFYAQHFTVNKILNPPPPLEPSSILKFLCPRPQLAPGRAACKTARHPDIDLLHYCACRLTTRLKRGRHNARQQAVPVPGPYYLPAQPPAPSASCTPSSCLERRSRPHRLGQLGAAEWGPGERCESH